VHRSVNRSAPNPTGHVKRETPGPRPIIAAVPTSNIGGFSRGIESCAVRLRDCVMSLVTSESGYEGMKEEEEEAWLSALGWVVWHGQGCAH